MSGDILVSGRSVKNSNAGEAGKEIASIFQDPRSQFFTTNSSSEVAFACENYGIAHEEIVRRVDRSFGMMNMEGMKNRDIFSLSSGERQKIAFLAATTLNPEIYVLDEPSANLDIYTILQVKRILTSLKETGHTIIISEHRLFYLNGLADRFLIMEGGRIREELNGEEMAHLSSDQMHLRKLRALNIDTISPENNVQTGIQEEVLNIRNLSFSYKNGRELLHNISFHGNKGETIALVGENGFGKTTLGKIMAGLIRCKKGEFFVEGKKVKQKKLSDYVYFVMQEADHQLYTAGVYEELLLGNKKVPDIEEKISNVLEVLNLSEFRDNHPYALSGGQKQRLTIGTAMLSDKPVIVLDEPTSGLDWENMRAVADAVNYLKDMGKLVFIITHDPEFLSLVASRALLMKDGLIKKDLFITSDHVLRDVRNFMLQEGGE
jgi:energy-coupling factor transport system ATP-binding protein